jgi:glyoxylase-like metal-dependent hydrolase (beta-lactamase superfamily II)
MAQVKKFVFNELGVNTFVVYDETSECLIVDPGCNSDSQRDALSHFISANALKPVAIVNTHGHFDHLFGNPWVRAEYACPLFLHKEDLPLLEHADKYAGIFGFSINAQPIPEKFLEQGDTVHFGKTDLQVIHVPGHSPGSICLYSDSGRFLICGDVLFRGSIGRTDLFGGDYDLLVSGIKSKILDLPPETIVYCGHGPETTIGEEHDTNPFLK